MVHFEQMWLQPCGQATPPIFLIILIFGLITASLNAFCSFHPNSLVFSVFPGDTGYPVLVNEAAASTECHG